MIDRESLLALTEGNHELLADLVELFHGEGPRLVREMESAVRAGDAVCLRRAAHTLAGNARTFAAPELAELARAVERLAVAGELAAAARLLPELEAGVTDLYHGLASLTCREVS